MFFNLVNQQFGREEKMSIEDIRETMEGRPLKLAFATQGLYIGVPGRGDNSIIKIRNPTGEDSRLHNTRLKYLVCNDTWVGQEGWNN